MESESLLTNKILKNGFDTSHHTSCLLYSTPYSLAGWLYCSLHLPLSTPESQRPVRLSTAATRPISSLLIAPCPHL